MSDPVQIPRDRTVHVSRTMMSNEFIELMKTVPSHAPYESYEQAIVEDNVLMKRTASNRKKTLRFLRELYSLDLQDPLFAALRTVWSHASDTTRPLLCLLNTLFVDEVFRPTAKVILAKTPGAALEKTELLDAVQAAYPDRFGEKSFDKIARNSGSSWTQSGHLRGRVNKKRQRIEPDAAAAAFAAYLGWLDGARGLGLLDTLWARALDTGEETFDQLLFRASQTRLVKYKRLGDVLEVDFQPLEEQIRSMRGQH